MSDTTSFYLQGLRYAELARSMAKQERYAPDFVHNIALMAIEGLVMAICSKHGKLPYNHSLPDLSRALAAVLPIDREQQRRITRLARFQDLCSMDAFFRVSIQRSDLPELISVLDLVQALIEPAMEASHPAPAAKASGQPSLA